MPTVFTKEGFRFFFYSNEHTPIHIHVQKGGGEAVFDIEPTVQLRESVGLKLAELRRAEELAIEQHSAIIKHWNDYFSR